jgi:hypothetical protein
MESMTKKFLWLPAVSVLALPFVHPFGPVRRQHAQPMPDVPAPIERACQNCHSQRTEWPLYSYLPLVSWALEKDVSEARQTLDFSRWDRYSMEEKRDLLARIATEVRNHGMPLPRYLLLHPEARLSEEEIQVIYEWTKSERRAARKILEDSGNKPGGM